MSNMPRVMIYLPSIAIFDGASSKDVSVIMKWIKNVQQKWRIYFQKITSFWYNYKLINIPETEVIHK